MNSMRSNCGSEMQEDNDSVTFYESFCEKDEVVNIINEILILEDECDSELLAERLYDKMKVVLDKYQQQPHLLDAHIGLFIRKLLLNVYGSDDCRQLSTTSYHLSMKCLYHLCKVRGFKTFIRHFPHEVADIEPVLSLLSKQSPKDTHNWETNYVLLLWLSILIKLPFNLKRFDTCDGDNVPLMQRVLQAIKQYLVVYGKCSEAAAFLCARFLTRPDISKEFLQPFVEWCLPLLNEAMSDSSKFNSTIGVLLALSYIFKVGKREEVMRYGSIVLEKISDFDFEKQKHEYFVKLVVKLLQRIGLCFLKFKVAPWRYSRGKRCLEDNLIIAASCDLKQNGKEHSDDEDDDSDDFDDSHLSEVETVIEMLLSGLKDKSTLVRWSAAKGIGRICERLSKEMGEEVVQSVFNLCTSQSSESMMHGICLALAELCRRGLILPIYLKEAVEFVKKALVYDELKGSFSVGANVRDAACYVCWSFARAYEKNVMTPFVNDIATSLLIVAVFDREVNCRRAASAAFQESVGRQGNFPNGIDIVTTVDHHAVGCRNTAFLELSVFIAQFQVYTKPLILHLLDHKVHHWDANIRELAAKALHKLSLISSPEFVIKEVLSRLVINSCQSNAAYLSMKHGSIISAAYVIHALYMKNVVIPEDILKSIKSLSQEFKEKGLLHSSGCGEYMKQAMSVLIEKSSLSELNFRDDEEFVNLWTDFLKETIDYIDEKIRECGLNALTPFCDFYLRNDRSLQDKLIAHFLSRVRFGEEHCKCGALDALSRIPDSMIEADSPSIILFSLLHFLRSLSPSDYHLTSAKAAAINCMTQTIIRLDPTWTFTLVDTINDVLFYCVNTAMEDYAKGSRGDIGLVVRIAAIDSVKRLLVYFSSLRIKTFSTETFVKNLFSHLLPHCFSPQDKMRAVAASAFFELLHSSLINIPHRKEMAEIFTSDLSKTINWREGTSYTLFCQLLPLESYTKCLWEGLVLSVGGISASVVKKSREALSNTLMILKNSNKCPELVRIFEGFLDVFRERISCERLCESLIITLDYLISSEFLDEFDDKIIADTLSICWQSVGKSSDVKKNISIGSLFCNSLRFKECSKQCLRYLIALLFKRFPKVRVSIADSFYTALITFGDTLEVQDLDAALQILVDNDWSQPVNKLQHLRNTLNTMFSL